jgi:hypothetical protein
MKITQYILAKPFKLTLSLTNYYWKIEIKNHKVMRLLKKKLKQPQL